MADNDSTGGLSLWAEILRLDRELDESVKVIKHIVKIIDAKRLSDDEKVKKIRVYINSVNEKKSASNDKDEEKDNLRYVVSGGALY